MSLFHNQSQNWHIEFLHFECENISISITFTSAWDSFRAFLAMILDNNSYISVYLMPDCLFYFFYLRYLCDFSFCDKCDTDTEWKIIANLAKCSLAKKWLSWEDYPGSIVYSQLAMREDKQVRASILKYWSIEVMMWCLWYTWCMSPLPWPLRRALQWLAPAGLGSGSGPLPAISDQPPLRAHCCP